jgi:hypothetical protein
MMAPEPEDKKDMKRAHVVLSKGQKVVGLGYSRVTGVATKVMDKRENSGNHDRVNRVSQNSNTDQQADRVGRVGQVTPNSSTDRRIDQVSRVDNIEQKKEVPIGLLTRRDGLQRIRLTRRARLRRIQLTQKTGLCKTQGATYWKKENVLLQAKGSSTVVPKGYYQDAKTQIAKYASKRVDREKEDEERDYCFNRLWPITKPK